MYLNKTTWTCRNNQECASDIDAEGCLGTSALPDYLSATERDPVRELEPGVRRRVWRSVHHSPVTILPSPLQPLSHV